MARTLSIDWAPWSACEWAVQFQCILHLQSLKSSVAYELNGQLQRLTCNSEACAQSRDNKNQQSVQSSNVQMDCITLKAHSAGSSTLTGFPMGAWVTIYKPFLMWTLQSAKSWLLWLVLTDSRFMTNSDLIEPANQNVGALKGSPLWRFSDGVFHESGSERVCFSRRSKRLRTT